MQSMYRLSTVARPLSTVNLTMPAQRLGWLPTSSTQNCRNRLISTHALNAEDKLEIMELCYRFDNAMNVSDSSMALDLFAKDAKLQSPKGTAVGHPALKEYLKAVEAMAKGNRHLTSNIMIEGGNERAHASSYRILHKASAPPMLLATGTIEDTLVKIDGEWKFQERRFYMDAPPPAN